VLIDLQDLQNVIHVGCSSKRPK